MLTRIALAFLAVFGAAVVAGCELSATATPESSQPAHSETTSQITEGEPGQTAPDGAVTAPSGDAKSSAPARPDISPTQLARANFRLLISDEQNAIGDFAHLWVTIDRVGIQQGGESGGWHELEIPHEHRRVDLVMLQGDASEELIKAYITPGRYSKVFVHVDGVSGELRSGGTTPVKLPSERLHIVKPFEVLPDSLTTFVFDITVVPAGNVDREVKYVLKPVIGESGADHPLGKEMRPEPHEDEGAKLSDSEAPLPPEDENDEKEVEASEILETSSDPLDEQFALKIASPAEETSFVDSPHTEILGLTRVDAVVSVNDDLVDVDESGNFAAVVELEEGPNIIEVVASVAEGEEEYAILTVFYIPEEGQQ